MRNKKTILKSLLLVAGITTLLSETTIFGFGRRGGGWGRGRGRGWGRGGIVIGGRGGGFGGGIFLGGRGRGRGFGFGINLGPRFWGRPGWAGWEGPYWGERGLWLNFHNHWRHRRGWPHIYNETGERIKLNISNRYRNRYTLTVVTESGQTKEFPGLELPDMRNVEVFIDQNGELQAAPR